MDIGANRECSSYTMTQNIKLLLLSASRCPCTPSTTSTTVRSPISSLATNYPWAEQQADGLFSFLDLNKRSKLMTQEKNSYYSHPISHCVFFEPSADFRPSHKIFITSTALWLLVCMERMGQ